MDKIALVNWHPGARSKRVEHFLARERFSPKAERVAREVLDSIRARGNAAVLESIAKFDGVKRTAKTLRVTAREMASAERTVDAPFKRAVRAARRRIERFAKAGIRADWSMPTDHGGSLGERFTPLSRIVAYIPGGAAPLASTALMSIALARVAGVKEIVACSPAQSDGKVDAFTLYAMKEAGATEIYAVGGIQAIGAMAYGTETIASVEKIVGPGGAYVTAAKRLVYGTVDLDLVAGPSELAIIADSTAHARYVAADLLSQAEHGTGEEKTLLITTSAKLAKAVIVELKKQAARLSRRKATEKVLARGT